MYLSPLIRKAMVSSNLLSSHSTCTKLNDVLDRSSLCPTPLQMQSGLHRLKHWKKAAISNEFFTENSSNCFIFMNSLLRNLACEFMYLRFQILRLSHCPAGQSILPALFLFAVTRGAFIKFIPNMYTDTILFSVAFATHTSANVTEREGEQNVLHWETWSPRWVACCVRPLSHPHADFVHSYFVLLQFKDSKVGFPSEHTYLNLVDKNGWKYWVVPFLCCCSSFILVFFFFFGCCQWLFLLVSKHVLRWCRISLK